MMITSEHLRLIMPACPAEKRETYARHLSTAMEEADITTVTRAAAFLGQIALESGELHYWEEIADGSRYEGRKDLGNVHKGDGRRYKGRGPLQLTGRANYRDAGRALGIDLEIEPGLVATPPVGFRVAAWFWTSRGLNAKADALELRGITRAINGGFTHQDRRLEYTHRALAVLGTGVRMPGRIGEAVA